MNKPTNRGAAKLIMHYKNYQLKMTGEIISLFTHNFKNYELNMIIDQGLRLLRIFFYFYTFESDKNVSEKSLLILPNSNATSQLRMFTV